MTSVDSKVMGFHGPGEGLVVIGLVFAILSIGSVMGRILSRVTVKRALGIDDYIMVASLVCAIAFSIITTVGVSFGYGQPDKSLSKEDLRKALKMFFACQIAYKFSMNLTKLSILTLYLRIFIQDWFQLLVRWIIAALIVFSMTSIGGTIFQCQPFARAWDHAVPGRCFSLVKFWYFNASLSIFSDLVILFLPMPLIAGLKLPRSQKIGLVAIFGLGVFVCITSIIRMTVLKTGAVSRDVSHGTLKSTIWTAIECHTAIICASLPMLKSTMSKLFPRIFPNSQASHNTEADNDGNGDDAAAHPQSITPTHDTYDCEAASDPPSWLDKYEPGDEFQIFVETDAAQHNDNNSNHNHNDVDHHHLDHHHHPSSLLPSLHLHSPPSSPKTTIPKTYFPKGRGRSGAARAAARGKARGRNSTSPSPPHHPSIDGITKTTEIEIEFEPKYEPKYEEEEEGEDSSSAGSVVRFGGSGSGSGSGGHQRAVGYGVGAPPSRGSRKLVSRGR